MHPTFLSASLFNQTEVSAATSICCYWARCSIWFCASAQSKVKHGIVSQSDQEAVSRASRPIVDLKAGIANGTWGRAFSTCFPRSSPSTRSPEHDTKAPLTDVDAPKHPPADAPQRVVCPSGPLVTSTGSPLDATQVLENREADYQAKRGRKAAVEYLKYLGSGRDIGYTARQILDSTGAKARLMIPSSCCLNARGTACSGGGLRASLYCAGTLSALDNRYGTYIAPVLQLSAYMTGLSGGSWAITSLATSNLGPTSIYDIVMGRNGAPGWKLDLNLIFPSLWHLLPFNINIIPSLSGCAENRSQSLAGRLLGHHFLPGTTRASFFSSTAPNDNGLLFDAIKSTSKFRAFEMPYPIVVTTSRVKAWDQFKVFGDYIPMKNTIFEISPYSFGSYDPSLSAHIPTEYMGSDAEGGKTRGGRTCVNGFDSASFIMGCSAGLFTAIESMLRPDTRMFSKILEFIHWATRGDKQEDFLTSRVKLTVSLRHPAAGMRLLSDVVPNTFHGYNPRLRGSREFESAENHHLYLTDGGMNGENIPLAPLLVKARRLDTIFAIDASHDTKKSWPNGESLHRTWERIRLTANGYTDFPPVPPTPFHFVAWGLTTRPVFFGCEVRDAHVNQPGSYPIIIYLPNAPVQHSRYSTNTATMQMAYSNSDTEAFLANAHMNAMKGYPMGNAGSDPHYRTALKCAIVDRARQRASLKRSRICAAMLARCKWTGEEEAEPDLWDRKQSTGR
ncbi:BZ3500_MvSof-1268-A1-R1_Chr1-1g00846 [Microbotryum saponariae]|uniref:Lysophospholipase n=1 Tax=Microbotryum saponariae TaxID=289078 RepID=A0A2X0KLS4_9BASI|nr:BZ3500_MvSof-1268-A1-R1_Chr1-1g00846 [Microbotryum saponariae]SCZ92768.1 BZ3501_MvSof-1269-A2-R1_Chr1-1g00443 [Microbotryum saponariae]